MGSVEEAARLARDYRNDTPPNLPRAVEFYELASRGGDKQCATELARLFATGGPGLVANPTAARAQAQRAAELGSGPGQMLYAQFLLDGLGGDRDPVEAARWMREAASRHFPAAQNAYGLMLINGTGMLKNEREGVEWITKAAASEEPLALLFLGESYLNGRYGLPADLKLGRTYLTAAARGSDQAVAGAAKAALAEAEAPEKPVRVSDLLIAPPAGKKATSSIYDSLRIDRVASPAQAPPAARGQEALPPPGREERP
jgi:TPR repeat protein